MYWGIFNDYNIRHYKPQGKKAILIRALEPSYKQMGIPYNIKYLSSYVNVLELYFQDFREVPPEKYKDRFKLFNEKLALELIDFIKNNDFDEIAVHCSAGISRSSAIMICISRIINNKEIEDTIFKHTELYDPNPLVLQEFDKVNNKVYKVVSSDTICSVNISSNFELDTEEGIDSNGKFFLRIKNLIKKDESLSK